MAPRMRTEDGPRRKLDADLEADLDRALAQTFPASDPFSVGQFTGTEPPSRPVDRKAPEPARPPRSRRKRKSPGPP